MAAYRRVNGFKSPASDCLYTGISSGPNAWQRDGKKHYENRPVAQLFSGHKVAVDKMI